MDLINAKTVSITSSFVEGKVQFYVKLLFVVLHFTVRMHLGMQKNNNTSTTVASYIS